MDLSEVDYLYLSVYAENPSAYNFQEGPAVRLVDQDGSYFEYNFYENGGVKTLINDAVGQWIMLEIPLDAPENPEEGWGQSRVGTPDLAGIRYLEIHADTWTAGLPCGLMIPILIPSPRAARRPGQRPGCGRKGRGPIGRRPYGSEFK